MGKRYSIFYLIGSLASAFGGILAFGLMQMEGIQGYGGWRWIFIIEGCVCTSCTPFLVRNDTLTHSSSADLPGRFPWLHFLGILPRQPKVPIYWFLIS